MRDIMCNGYVAGSNTRFFGLEHGKSSFNNPATPTRVTQTLNERLSRNDDAGGEYASMLAFLTPYSEVEENSRDQVISISNRVLPWEVAHSHSGDSKAYFPGGDKGFDTYKSWQLNQIHYGEDVRASESMSFITNGSVNNALCFIGPHRRYNPFTQNFYELVAGQGHFGPDAIPGVRAPSALRPQSYAHTTSNPLTCRFDVHVPATTGRAMATRRGCLTTLSEERNDFLGSRRAVTITYAPIKLIGLSQKTFTLVGSKCRFFRV